MKAKDLNKRLRELREGNSSINTITVLLGIILAIVASVSFINLGFNTGEMRLNLIILSVCIPAIVALHIYINNQH